MFDTVWTQEQEQNQSIEQLERSANTLQNTFRDMEEGQRRREADLQNREALILRLRYQMELLSRLTDEHMESLRKYRNLRTLILFLKSETRKLA